MKARGIDFCLTSTLNLSISNNIPFPLQGEFPPPSYRKKN